MQCFIDDIFVMSDISLFTFTFTKAHSFCVLDYSPINPFQSDSFSTWPHSLWLNLLNLAIGLMRFMSSWTSKYVLWHNGVKQFHCSSVWIPVTLYLYPFISNIQPNIYSRPIVHNGIFHSRTRKPQTELILCIVQPKITFVKKKQAFGLFRCWLDYFRKYCLQCCLFVFYCQI